MGLPVKLVREGGRELLAIYGVAGVSALNPEFEQIETRVDIKNYPGTDIFYLVIRISESMCTDPKVVTITLDTKKDAEVIRLMTEGTDLILIASPDINDFMDTAIDVAAWSAIDGGFVYVHLTDDDRQLLHAYLTLNHSPITGD